MCFISDKNHHQSGITFQTTAHTKYKQRKLNTCFKPLKYKPTIWKHVKLIYNGQNASL